MEVLVMTNGQFSPLPPINESRNHVQSTYDLMKQCIHTICKVGY